jgi:hypothetical protein
MNDQDKRIPPYLPFKTFISSLDVFAHGVPPRLDRSIWRNQAGLMQGLILNAYRFFGLVEEEHQDAASEYLTDMARDPGRRQTVLRDLLMAQYWELLEENDLTKISMKMLEEAFEKYYAVSGATKEKAISFFLKAAQFADMPLSPFLMTKLRNVGARKKRGSKPRPEDESAPSETPRIFESPVAAAESVHSVELQSGGTLTVSITANPFKMPAEDRAFVFGLIDRLQEYEAQHGNEVEEEEGN